MRTPLNNDQHRLAAKKAMQMQREGVPQEQAITAAMNMARQDRLDDQGGYITVPARR